MDKRDNDRPPGWISKLVGSEKPCVIRSVGGRHAKHLWFAFAVMALMFLGYAYFFY